MSSSSIVILRHNRSRPSIDTSGQASDVDRAKAEKPGQGSGAEMRAPGREVMPGDQEADEPRQTDEHNYRSAQGPG